MKLDHQVAELIDVNPRKERHGEDKVLALDVKLRATCEAGVLDQFDATLKGHLYGDHGPRFPEIESYAWRREFENCDVKIAGKQFKEVTIRKIALQPQVGEAVVVEFVATWYPNPEDVGALAQLLGEQVVIDTELRQRDIVDEQKAA